MGREHYSAFDRTDLSAFDRPTTKRCYAGLFIHVFVLATSIKPFGACICESRATVLFAHPLRAIIDRKELASEFRVRVERLYAPGLEVEGFVPPDLGTAALCSWPSADQLSKGPRRAED